jgi:hypothetical protein
MRSRRSSVLVRDLGEMLQGTLQRHSPDTCMLAVARVYVVLYCGLHDLG